MIFFLKKICNVVEFQNKHFLKEQYVRFSGISQWVFRLQTTEYPSPLPFQACRRNYGGLQVHSCSTIVFSYADIKAVLTNLL